MKLLSVLGFIVCATFAFATSENRTDSFRHFQSEPVSTTFGLAQAQRLADEQRRAKYGNCGMSVFKEKKGAVWIFATKVGYAGAVAPDISVVEPPSSPLSFGKTKTKANQSVEPTSPFGRRGSL